MATKVLLIGATGNIGGAVLEDVLKTYPNVTVVAQVRSEKDSDILKNQYAQYDENFQTVVTGDNSDALKKATESASIVINCGPDVTNEQNIKTTLSNLASSIAHQPKFYIGTSGAALIWEAPTGSNEARTWDDVSDIDDILAQPESVIHITADRIVQGGNDLHPLLHTAIVSPTFVAGISPSVKRPTPLVFPAWLHVIKSLGTGVTVNGGQNKTNFVDVNKLAELYVLLTGDALEQIASSSATPKGPTTKLDTWGPKAYYFGASLEVTFHKFMADIFLPALKKSGAPYFDSDTPKIKDMDDVEKIVAMVKTLYATQPGGEIWASHIAEGFAVDMRARGSRAEQVFKDKGFKWMGEGDAQDAGLAEAVKVFVELEKA